MKLKYSLLAFATASLGVATGQTSFTSTGVATAWNAARWNNSTDAAPYTSTFTSGNAVNFTSGDYSFAGMGASINVGNINVASGANVNFASAGSSIATGGNVRTITVAGGSTFDFQGQAFSTASGTGFIKAGDGVLALAGAGYNGGFTLNAGTVIARGVDAFGANASNVLTLNGGTVASNATRSFANTKHGGGIVIGGNVQFGELATVVSIASSTANLSFANNVSLGSVNRTFTQGNNGTNTFSAIISNTGSGGITFAANSGTDGRFDITNAANTFTGDININGGEVRFTTDGSMGNAANDIVIDGGRFATASGATYTLGAGRQIFVGDGAGTSISAPGAGVFTYNNAIANKSGETGSWAKQGGGTLQLGGVSTYTGDTAINNGIVQLTTGNDRLPTGTVVSLGQASSTNLGTLDLNGRNQQIAGLNSTTGTNATASNNTVTSTGAATLTIGGAGTYSYGGGTDANSGVITGAISLVKQGAGTQTLGDTNTYTGTTLVNGGTLNIAVGGSTAAASAVTVSNSGSALIVNGTINGMLTMGVNTTLSGTGTIGGDTTISGTHNPGNSPGIQTFVGNLSYVDGGTPDPTVNWELIGNTTTVGVNPNANFDQIIVGGNLDFADPTIINLSFNGVGSTVLWSDVLWDSNQSWLVYDVAGTTSNFPDNLDLTTINWLDSGGNLFSTTGGGSFSLGQVGQDVVLNYTYTIPEPSTALLGGLGVFALLLRRRR